MDTNETAPCFDNRTTDHSERLYQATYLSKVIFSSVSILITELASQSLKNRTGQEFEYPTVISQFIYV